jgi:exopolyphosphatase / guanosine-5'-triphosphate,3'-diphosphate pyrophosphatase
MAGTDRSAGEIRAVIDVGTNSVKLLVADVDGKTVRPLHESSHQTRLGQGFYETHVLQAGAIEQTAKAVAEFASEARRWEPASIKVIATSAARDAQNKQDLISALEAASGITAEIISGSQEADWAFKGATSDPKIGTGPLLVMDVGGGSSEFILGNGGQRSFAESVPIGSVRLLEKIRVTDPPKEIERKRCEDEVRGVIEGVLRPNLEPEMRRIGATVQLVATGGSSTILARVKLRLRSFSREVIEGTILSRDELASETTRLWSMTLEERRHVIGLPANRADVILTGAIIFREVMEVLDIDRLHVSTRGLRFAALMD